MNSEVRDWIRNHNNKVRDGKVHEGQTVLYILNENDQDTIERLVKSNPEFCSTAPMPGEIYPCLVTAAWSGTHINGRVYPDGNVALPVFKVPFGYDQGNWFFMGTRL